MLALRGALGFRGPSPLPRLPHRAGLSPDVGDLYAVMRAGGIVRCVRPSGSSPNLERRLALEVPWSLVLAASIGEAVGVDTPVVDGLVALAGARLGRDLRSEGRTLERLGLGGLDADGLRSAVDRTSS
ncbi:MAG: hypothetical protein ACT4PO_02885 [Actinomycetota bacterium]